jgi:mitochondrial fission protein ELM1
VDQQYLADPALLFDADMEGAGFLALSPQDTAVMLIDCDRMKSVWSLDDARHGRRKPIEAKARDHWGRLPPEWHCRDWEFVEGRSRCMHYTTIHSQPWQPFPSVYVYQRSNASAVWESAEAAADRARYQPFSLEHASQGYLKSVDLVRERQRDSAHQAGPSDLQRAQTLQPLVERTGARTLLEVTLGGKATPVDGVGARRSGLSVTRYDPVDEPASVPGTGFDAVSCWGTFEHLCDDDACWVLDEIFMRARTLVHVTVHQRADSRLLDHLRRKRRSARPPAWWYDRLRETSARYSNVHWRLDLAIASRRGDVREYCRTGGRRLDGPPRTWVLLDHKPGHTTQSLGLVQALGWPYELKSIPYQWIHLASDRLLGPFTFDPGGARRAMLAEPWPDLVVSTGWRTAPITRWIGEQSAGRTRTVQLGRKGGSLAQHYDAVVTCAHTRYPVHTRRVETLAPLNRVTADELARAAKRWADVFGDAPRPHVVLLVGGSSREHRIDAEVALALGGEVAARVGEAGGTVFAVTSRRTGTQVESALETGLGETGRICRWATIGSDNPYLGYLALADALVVTSDSESMLAEAASTGKPLYIYRVPERSAPPVRRLAKLVTDTAYSQPRKSKGTIRPQQGREYLCSRLIERGVIRPPRDMDAMCGALVERGIARWWQGGPLVLSPRPALDEAGRAGKRIRDLLGWTTWEAPAEPWDRQRRPAQARAAG